MALHTKFPLLEKMKTRYFIPLVGLVGLLILIFFYIQQFHSITQTNLIKFHSLIVEDPLFYDPNTDLKLLRTSVQTLKNEDDQIVRTNDSYQKNNAGNDKWDVFPKDWRIWPDGFLMTLPTIHELTASFVNKPTPEGAIALLNAYEQSVKEYKNAIELDIQAMETFLNRSPKMATTKILFLGSATTPEIVHNDFLLIRKNAQALETEIAERKKCLYEGVCLPKRSADMNMAQKDAVTVPFKPLPDNILEIDRSKDKVFGPFYIQTGCQGFTEDQKIYNLPFYMVEDKDGNLIPMPTNTKYYRDYRKVPQQAVAQIWLKRGISVRPHEALTDYLCTDLRYLPQLFLQYLKEKQAPSSTLSDKNLLSILPYLVERTSLLSEFMIYDLAYTKKPYSPLYLLVDRSAYSLYFGTFSPRIWRIPQSPAFLIQKDFTDSAFRAGFTKYEKLIADGMSEEEIAKLNSTPSILKVYQSEVQATPSAKNKEVSRL